MPPLGTSLIDAGFILKYYLFESTILRRTSCVQIWGNFETRRQFKCTVIMYNQYAEGVRRFYFTSATVRLKQRFYYHSLDVSPVASPLMK